MSSSTQPIDAHRFVNLSGGRIHYFEGGQAGRPQLHFLHANGLCSGTYIPFLRRLEGQLHLFASDVRGQGDSEPPASDDTHPWHAFVDDLTAFIQTKMDPPVIAMGHSLGAVVTYIAAARNPELFSALVLMDPVFLPLGWRLKIALLRVLGQQHRFPMARGARRRKRRFESYTAAYQRFGTGKGMFKTWSPDFIEAYLNCAFQHQPDGSQELKCDPELEAQIFESVPLNYWHWGQTISCPVLALRGQNSETFGAAEAAKLCRVVPDCQVETIPGCGHFLPMERPEACAQTILEFFRQRRIHIGG